MSFEVFNQQIFNAYLYRYNIELFTGSFNIYLDLINDYNDTTLSYIPTVGSNVLFNLYGFNIPGRIEEVTPASIYSENNNSTRINFSNPVIFNKKFKTPKIAYSVKIQSSQMLMKDFFSATLNSTLNLAIFSDSVDSSYRNWFINCVYNSSELNSFPTNLSLNFDANNYINNLIINGKRLSDSGNTIFIADSSSSRSKTSFETIDFTDQSSQIVNNETGSSPPDVDQATIPVYPVKYFGCYVSNFDGYLTINGEGKLNLYLYEDPSSNSFFEIPYINSDFTFNFDGLKFKGFVSRYEQKTNLLNSEIKKYFVEITCYEGVNNLSDQIFNKDVVTFNFSVTPSNIRIDSNNSNIDILVYLDTTSNPSTDYGSYFSWNSPNAFSLGEIKYTASKTWPPLMYEITGQKNISLSQIVVKNVDSSPSNPASIPSPPTSTISGNTEIISSLNSFGVGTYTEIQPNLSNEPLGTTITRSVDGGLTTEVTRTVTSSTITITTKQSFSPYLDTSSPMANKRRSLMGVPENFPGSIDPTVMFPSVEIYPSGKYLSKESGQYFGKSASPTSYDLDPYFYFTNNDFYFVAKDNLTNTKNINLQKDGIKNHVRTMGLRGPMYLSGWGYDYRGLPVPNASGLVSSGEYKFHPETSTNRGRWKTGPIDLRWHDKKKTWIGGHELLEGYLMENLSAPTSKDKSTNAKMSVYRVAESGGLKNKTLEYITLTNRDPSFSASSGDYCTALDINYEWRPLGGGGGGGNFDIKGKDILLMILGTEEEYKNCPGAPPASPGCWPAYAWAAYKVCGYQYKKLFDARTFKTWALELNGGGTGAWRRFHPAFWGWDNYTDGAPNNATGPCKGVRFINPGTSALVCECPTWLNEVQCLKFEVKFISKTTCENPGPIGCTCDSLFWTKLDDLWGTTRELIACRDPEGNCRWLAALTGETELGLTFLLSWVPIPPDANEDGTCSWGPSEFDPCNPCEGFSRFGLSVNLGKSQGGGFGNLYSAYKISSVNAMKKLVDNCGGEPPIEFEFVNHYSACPNIIESIKVKCCSQQEINGCTGN